MRLVSNDKADHICNLQTDYCDLPCRRNLKAIEYISVQAGQEA